MEKCKKNWPYFIYVGMVILYLYFRLLNPAIFTALDYNCNSEGEYDESVTDKVELTLECSTKWVITYPEEYNGKKVAAAKTSGDFKDDCPYTVKINFNKNLEEFYELFWSIKGSRLSEMTFSKDTRFKADIDNFEAEEYADLYDGSDCKVKFYE